MHFLPQAALGPLAGQDPQKGIPCADEKNIGPFLASRLSFGPATGAVPVSPLLFRSAGMLAWFSGSPLVRWICYRLQ